MLYIGHYQYTSLPRDNDSIRLLDISPASDPCKSLVGHVRTAKLSEKPRYQAISYHWGNSAKTKSIVLNNGSSLAITSSLHEALIAIRSVPSIDEETDSYTVWADGICINQEDIPERSYQVQLMRYIYSDAFRTILWIGPERDNSPQAILICDGLHKASERQNETDVAVDVHRLEEDPFLPPVYHEDWSGFCALFQRPWFTRAWVVQEVAVSRNAYLCCGGDRISWERVEIAIAYFISSGLLHAVPTSSVAFPLIMQLARQDYCRKKSKSLLDVLSTYRHFHATDPRDKIFAFLGLADPDELDSLQVFPDYSLEVKDLYKRVAIKILKKERFLEILACPRVTPEPAIGSIPSWVTDWASGDQSIPLTSLERAVRDEGWPEDFSPYDAAKGTTADAQFTCEGNNLIINGIIFDEVKRVSDLLLRPQPMTGNKNADWIEGSRESQMLLSSIEDLAQIGSSRPYPGGGFREDACIQTLSGAFLPLHILRPIWKASSGGIFGTGCRLLRWTRLHEKRWVWNILSHCLQAFGQISAGMKAVIPAFDLVEVLLPRTNAHTLIPILMSASVGRRMIRTKKGYLGFAPAICQAGDFVGVFHGSKTPLVVRRDAHASKDVWILVGDAYVHGVMYGELYDEGSCKAFCIS